MSSNTGFGFSKNVPIPTREITQNLAQNLRPSGFNNTIPKPQNQPSIRKKNEDNSEFKPQIQ